MVTHSAVWTTFSGRSHVPVLLPQRGAAHSTGMSDFLTRAFFARPFLTVAQDLVGCTLVWDGCAGMIVELEAYGAVDDPACHTSVRPSARQFVARHPPGTAYVYLNYGMYWLLNVLVKGGGEDGILLLRALEPREGIPLMQARRGRMALRDLCSGPGKLGRALALSRADHTCELADDEAKTQRERGFLPRDPGLLPDIIADGRIGLSVAGDRPWRFSLRDHPHVSVRPKLSAGLATIPQP